MKNYYLKALTLLSCLLLGITVHAHDFEAQNSDGVTIYYDITSSTDKTCEVTYRGSSYSQYSNEYTGEIVIPESVTYNSTTYSVTSIGGVAFASCSGLISVTIGNSVTSIGGVAFASCSGLISVTIGNSVTSIGGSAFNGCTGLTSVTIDDGVTSIGGSAFYGCTGLTSITIPNSVTSIGGSAFEDTGWYNNQPDGILYLDNCCLGYKGDKPTGELSLKDNTRLIADDAFFGCSGLTSITILNSVTSIGDYAFYGCSGLTSITIPNSVTSIGSSAFSGCTGLESIIVESGNTKYDSRDNCNAIIETSSNTLITGCKKTAIPNNITSIGYYAFYGCSGLTSVTIPNSVTSIRNYAFRDCTSLTNIIIPNSVISIDQYAFSGCTGLVSEKSRKTTPTKIMLEFSNNTNYRVCVIINYECYTTNDKIIETTGLRPNNLYDYKYGLIINNFSYIINTGKLYTPRFNIEIEGESGISSIYAKGYSNEDPSEISGLKLSLDNGDTEYDNQNEKTFTNLDPNTNYTIYYNINTKEGGVYSTTKTFTTGALTWSDEEYQATSTTSARLMTTTNCDATDGTGFEWRRYGAPENLKPNAVACPVVDGMLIGSLRNLNSEAYYEFRPYYTSSSGNTYYGEWTALFTGDANVYFEPEVRTYEDVVVSTNNATLKGYALAGTDDIVTQGFEYWESSVQPGTTNSLNASGNSMIVEVSGISMTTTISDLKYGTTYCYRAFATTSNGTVYGDIEEFTTEKDLSGIENVIVVEEDETIEYYNLQGVKIVNPERGLYIKRQGGKTSKVIL